MAMLLLPETPTKSEILANVSAHQPVKKSSRAVRKPIRRRPPRAWGKKGAGVFAALGLVRSRRKSSGRKAQKGVPNPSSRELMDALQARLLQD